MKTALAIFLLCVGVVCGRRLDVCKLPAAPGLCYASMPKFFYNPATKDCEIFTYGGCGGNANRFEFYEECAAACAEHMPMPRSLVDLEYRKPYKGVDFEVGCRPAPEGGQCRGDFERWFFNIETGRCEKFSYGGCGGNENNYETMGDCEIACLRF